METQICRICKTAQPLDKFSIRKTKASGKVIRYYQCKPCVSNKSVQWNKENSNKRLIQSAMGRAKKVSLEVSVDYDWIKDNISSHCPCCSRIFKAGPSNGRGKNSYDRPSLDRINPLIGYTKSNTRIICNECNRIKNNGTFQQHDQIAKWISRGAQQFNCDELNNGAGI